MSEGPVEAEPLPPAEVEEEHEGLLENDLYLLTQGQGQDDEEFKGQREDAPRYPGRSQRRKRASPETQHRPVGAMEPLALPAPADAALAAEATEDDTAGAAAEGAAAAVGAAAAEASPEMSPEDVAAEMERARKRKKFESKPVEARKEGDEGDWIHFPSLAAASRETGVPNGSIASLCTLQGSHTGWCFRWPGAQKLERSTPPRRVELPADETEAILRRLRAMSAEERRGALAAMPEGTRKELMRHLKQEAGGSRLRQLLSHLPELLDSADEQKRHELMQGVRMLESVTAQVLAAPDMASVVKILRELTPQQRHAIVESLPGETQQALTAHLRAEKAAQAAQLGSKVYAPAQQSLLPALCRML